MPYKQNCQVEGEIITKFKIARLYFSEKKKQREIARDLTCHYNTINNIIKTCKKLASPEILNYLKTSEKLSQDQLELFSFLKSSSRKPKSNKRCLSEACQKLILAKQEKLNCGPKRIFTHLKRQSYDPKTYTLAKIKGVYKRNNLATKKIRTLNGERRALYNYDEIEAFEYLQYDTKTIADQHSLPAELYNLFKYNDQLPKYQWTITDAKTRTRFLAWSYSLSSFFGFRFLELVVCWLRAHQIRVKIKTQFDGGAEFCSSSTRKITGWNEQLAKYDLQVTDTQGMKWKQNLVERTHRMDDEEFYVPRGEFIKNKIDFLVEGQHWIIYQNHRSHSGIGLNGFSPKEKLDQLGIYNAEQICNFPGLILEDFYQPFQSFFEISKLQDTKTSQNVLTPYHTLGLSRLFFV